MFNFNRAFWLGVGYGLALALTATGLILLLYTRPKGQPVALVEPPTPRPLRVDVKGAVARPGLYTLPRGSILHDALTAAGGALPNADLSRVNLAQALNDNDLVTVPALAPTLTPAPTADPAQPAPSPTTRSANPTLPPGTLININTATLEELDTLPRIGPALAQRIIDYRTANGPFQRLEDIQQVRGIGPALFAEIQPLITLGP